jgi:hypothetical protein
MEHPPPHDAKWAGIWCYKPPIDGNFGTQYLTIFRFILTPQILPNRTFLHNDAHVDLTLKKPSQKRKIR